MKSKVKYEVTLTRSYRGDMIFNGNSRNAYKYLKEYAEYDVCIVCDKNGVEVSRAVRVHPNKGNYDKSMILRGAWK